jgi:hypothetical protein
MVLYFVTADDMSAIKEESMTQEQKNQFKLFLDKSVKADLSKIKETLDSLGCSEVFNAVKITKERELKSLENLKNKLREFKAPLIREEVESLNSEIEALNLRIKNLKVRRNGLVDQLPRAVGSFSKVVSRETSSPNYGEWEEVKCDLTCLTGQARYINGVKTDTFSHFRVKSEFSGLFEKFGLKNGLLTRGQVKFEGGRIFCRPR